MTPEEVNRIIAEYCEWTRIEMGTPNIRSGKDLLGSRSCLMGTPPEDKDKPEDDQRFEPIPNFYFSLDEMRKAEMCLPDDMYHGAFTDSLLDLIVETLPVRRLLFAKPVESARWYSADASIHARAFVTAIRAQKC